jgi:8-oxo-dGTP pyrophosphatase MutT (NUDIX family)
MSFTRSSAESLATCPDLPARLAAELAAGGSYCRDGECFAPELSYGRHFGPAPVDARQAAVAVLVFPRLGRWHIPLTVRPLSLGRHGGQISLPGGAVDAGESTADAARRELDEELGVWEAVQMVGQLDECYVYVSNFCVTPWVAAIDREPTWHPHSVEVERVVEIPLDALVAPRADTTKTIERGPIVFRAPCHQLGDDSVWGATSIILGELAGVLRGMMERSDRNE